MKRAANLFERIADRENLRQAFWKSLRGKRARPDARQFGEALDRNLALLSQDLLDGSIHLGEYHQFVIHDPKERIITAPCFRERVLHHAVVNVCEPVFERWLIGDTYACRIGKGRIAALRRSRSYAQQFPAYLKLDIRKYFDSISHARLLSQLARLFKDRRVLDLFARVVQSFRGSAGQGLPIGSLTSQHLANSYLGRFDRFVKESLRVRGYVRYMDDMALWGGSTAALDRILAECQAFLHEELALELKPVPYLNRTSHGMDFLGCRVFPTHLELNRRSKRRFQRKLRALEKSFACGEVGETELQARTTALVAFTRTPGLKSWQFRARLLEQVAGGGLEARTG